MAFPPSCARGDHAVWERTPKLESWHCSLPAGVGRAAPGWRRLGSLLLGSDTPTPTLRHLEGGEGGEMSLGHQDSAWLSGAQTAEPVSSTVACFCWYWIPRPNGTGPWSFLPWRSFLCPLVDTQLLPSSWHVDHELRKDHDLSSPNELLQEWKPISGFSFKKEERMADRNRE